MAVSRSQGFAQVEDLVGESLGLSRDDVRLLGFSFDDPLARRVDREAHSVRVERLLADPSMRAALRVIRETPQMWDSVMQMVRQRGDEMRAASSVPGDMHRALTPLLAGIMLTPQARAVMDVALQRAGQRESDELSRRIGEGRAFVSQAVVGSGWHGSVLVNTMLGLDPNLSSITIDRAFHMGGQFANTPGDAHALNSRTRPERPDLVNQPGSEGSINPTGLSPIQVADVETMSYGAQSTLGMVNATNQLLASPTLMGHEVRWVRPGGNFGKVELVSRDLETGLPVTTVHDRVVFTSGVGDVRTALPGADPVTQALIERELGKPIGERRITTYTDEYVRMADPENPFPTQGRKQVAVFGAGDGGRTIVGKLLGYETANHMSVPNVDWVEGIGWYRQDASSREEFLRAERPRYHLIGNEFPRESDPNYYSRIKPISARATQLREEVDGEGNQTGRILVISDEAATGDREVAYDHVILAPGFVDRTSIALSTLNPAVYFGLSDTILDDPKPGTRFIGEFGQVVIEDVNDGVFEVSQIDREGVPSVKTLQTFELFDLLRDIEGSLERVEVPTEPSTELIYSDYKPTPRILRDREQIKAEFDRLWNTKGVLFRDGRLAAVQAENAEQMRELVARGAVESVLIPANRTAAIEAVESDPVAKKVIGGSVYLVGPAAQLPVSEAERARTPVLNEIPDNSVAGFRYVPLTEKFAALLVGADADLRDPGGLAGSEILDPGLPYALPPDKRDVGYAFLRRLSVRDRVADRSLADVVVNGGDAEVRFPANADWGSLVALAVAEADEMSRSSKVFKREMTMRWERAGGDGSRWQVRVVGVTPAARMDTQALLGDPLLARVVDKHLQSGAAAAEIRIPEASQGRVDLQSVSIRTVSPSRDAGTARTL
jgi:hypothetical protein